MQTPRELELPKKFKFWRDGQYEVIEDICQSDKGVYLLDAPAGIGKSLIGVAVYSKIAMAKAVLDRMVGREARYRCIYVTRTKQLQNQLLREFPMAKSVKGRSNYPCLAQPEALTAEDCFKPDTCSFFAACPYRIARAEAASAPLAVLNDAYFLAETNGEFLGRFSGANLVVLDEVDSIEGALMNYIQFTVSEMQLKRLQLEPPKDLSARAEWFPWASRTSFQINEYCSSLSSKLEFLDDKAWSDIEIGMQKQLTHLTNFSRKLAIFIGLVNENWIFSYAQEEKGWRVTFKPVLVAEYADAYLWRHGSRFLGMSATIFDPNILASDIGLTEWGYCQLDSPFPVENRPIYYQPAANLRRSSMDQELPKLAEAVSGILDKYPESRVLVHTVNYRIRDYLVGVLPQQQRLMTHSTEDRDEKLKTFSTSGEPLVMISPSFDRGVSLDQEACRCIIICKVPYLDMSDEQVRARMSMPDGQRWYNLRAAQTLVQMSGRAVRSKDDYCDTYILDRQFERLLARTRHILPKWWLEAIR